MKDTLGCVILASWALLIPVSAYWNYVGANTALDWTASQIKGEPTNVPWFINLGVMVLSPTQLPLASGALVKYVLDTDTDVRTPYQIDNGLL